MAATPLQNLLDRQDRGWPGKILRLWITIGVLLFQHTETVTQTPSTETCPFPRDICQQFGSLACLHGSTCLQLPSDPCAFLCACRSGYTGETCDTSIATVRTTEVTAAPPPPTTTALPPTRITQGLRPGPTTSHPTKRPCPRCHPKPGPTGQPGPPGQKGVTRPPGSKATTRPPGPEKGPETSTKGDKGDRGSTWPTLISKRTTAPPPTSETKLPTTLLPTLPPTPCNDSQIKECYESSNHTNEASNKKRSADFDCGEGIKDPCVQLCESGCFDPMIECAFKRRRGIPGFRFTCSCRNNETYTLRFGCLGPMDFDHYLGSETNKPVPQPSNKLVYVVAGVCGGVLLLLIIGVLVTLRYLWRRRVLWVQRLVFTFLPPEDDDSSQYDAFLSYRGGGVGEDFVVSRLFPKLEKEWGYKVVFHARDFIPGNPIANNIIEAVEQSRRVILVLTRDFLQSEWCRLEYQAAQQRMLERKTSILPIMLEDISEEQDMDKNLRYILKSVTYLEVPASEKEGEVENEDSDDMQKFWQRLRFALPKKRDVKTKSTIMKERSKGIKLVHMSNAEVDEISDDPLPKETNCSSKRRTMQAA